MLKKKYSKQEIDHLLDEIIQQMNKETRFLETKQYLQHGNMTVYEHCVCVAEKSCEIAWRMNLNVDYSVLIRGALLHDYFLYDWHEKDDNTHRLHGFFHPGKAYENASHDVNLTEIEGDIIRHHMFPLTVIPPQSKEAWVVCMADKVCATKETIHRR